MLNTRFWKKVLIAYLTQVGGEETRDFHQKFYLKKRAAISEVEEEKSEPLMT